MIVRYYTPSPSLRFLINSYVYYNLNTYDRLYFVPCGYPYLSINFGNGYCVYNEKHNGECIKSHYFIGNAKTSYSLVPKGKFNGLIIRFKPAALSQLLKLSLNEITDSAVSVYDLKDKEYRSFTEKITGLNNVLSCIQAIEEFFLEKSSRSDIQLLDIDHATEYVQENMGNITVCDIADKLNISIRSLERKFMQYTGLTPKQFAKIVRLNSILNRINSGDPCKSIDIAYQFGYFDQTHFIKDFKSFTGEIPSAFIPGSFPLTSGLSNMIRMSENPQLV
jgi:AraC-like DNA-binding protein